MKLRDTSQPNIVAAKIINVTPKNVTVITEKGHLLKIPLTKQYREDKTLRASLVDILKAGIWIPVNKKLKNLNKKKSNLLNLAIEGIISEKEFKLERQKIDKELKKVKNRHLKGKDNNRYSIKKIKSNIKDEFNSKNTLNKMIDLLLDYIIASKIDDNKIGLNIYIKLFSKEKIPSTKYNFKRGYDVEKTKKYIINYYVNYFFC